ncbi:hypothetical protein [Micromonospora sp. IBSANI012]|uniref:hypothetical protein n=1 Tax=Micromonospora sp. IBSANI012 TaxID=3457761 RepID=UPI0040584102
MKTLSDVISGVRDIPVQRAAEGWPPGYRPKAKIQVPGESKLVLPGDPAGISAVGDFGESIFGRGAEESASARGLLIADPVMVIPLRKPSQETLEPFSLEGSSRRVNPREVGLAACLRTSGSTLVYGVSRLLVAENALGFGSTLILRFVQSWTEDVHEFAVDVLGLCSDSAPHYEPKPDPKSKPWKTVTALLGGAKSGKLLPEGWQRDFKFAAGLYSINLDLRPNPESARAIVVNDLQSNPPDALLVWANFVASPDSFIQPFLSARPGGYASMLGSAAHQYSHDEHSAELLMHLGEIARSPQPEDALPNLANWKEAKVAILALEGKHFVLSDRARAMLENNPYPRPARMYEHIRKLSLVAKEYHNRDGNLGISLAGFSMAEHGIEIALTDKGLSPPAIEIERVTQTLSAIPHVKVDDAKSPDQCGRIYFAIDQELRRLVVDHIGLHDYG